MLPSSILFHNSFILFEKSCVMLLILLCKYPIPWKVKTRLWKTIGMQKAAEFQRKCLEKLIETHSHTWKYKFLIWVAWQENIEPFCKDFWVSSLEVFAQQWNDLWQIMSHALAYWHSITRTVCLIGSDVPVFTSDHAYKALRWLDHHDIVVGPSDDGGYYCIGSTSCIDEILLWMTYSTSTVCEETLNRAQQYGHSTTILHSMIDIDDLQALRDAIEDDTTWWISNIVDQLQIHMN